MDAFNYNRYPDFEGGEILLIDKPVGWSSFDIVKKMRNIISSFIEKDKIKIGHAGTLDPLATGLLIIVTGKATKLIEQLQEGEKTYEATFQLGATTPSFDMETQIDKTFDFKDISVDVIENVLKSMKGISFQTPPIYSAIQIKGKRAYEYARKGKSVKLEPRQINISELVLNNIDMPFVNVTITCSKGTYIRTFADDFGKKLNNGAFLYKLRRIKSGSFSVENAVDLINFEKNLKKCNLLIKSS